MELSIIKLQRNIAIDLCEAVSQATIDRNFARRERKLQASVIKWFGKQQRAVLRSFAAMKKQFDEAEEDRFNSLFDRAVAAANNWFIPILQDDYESALLFSGLTTIAEFDLDIDFTIENKRATAYARDHAANAVKDIDETTKLSLRSIIANALKTGTSYNDTAKQIAARYTEFSKPTKRGDRTRAELIAVTELAQARQYGNLAAVQAATDTGLTFEKRWITVGDDRVSDGCQTNADQGWIDADSPFDSGDDCPPRFPGCRCANGYRRKK